MMKFCLFTIFFLCSFNHSLTNDIKNLKNPDSDYITILKEQDNYNIRCFLYQNYNVFDLGGLSRPFKAKEDLSIPLNNSKAKIFYNFCENTLKSCNGTSSLMIAEYGDGKCERLAGSASNTNKWSLDNDPNNASSTFISITLNNGQSCTKDPSLNYSVIYKLYCDKEGDSKKIKWNEDSLNLFDPENCNNTLVASTKEACSQVNFYILAEFLNKYNWLLGTVMILLGLIELFFGKRLIVFTTFLISSILVISVVFVFFFEFIIPKGSNPNIVWVILGISGILGLVLGYYLSKGYKIFVGLFGGYLGYLLGTITYSIIMSHIDWNQTALQWITICTMIGICLLLSYLLADHILIICTSFVGGYLTIRGISLYAGGFPDEQLIKDLMTRGEYEEIKKILNVLAYIYFASWIVLFLIGVIVQFRINKEEDKTDDQTKINNAAFYFKMNKD